ncbi:MAG TPA: DUF1015 family protein [Cyclobacteriaceae bacterium]|nr:DUF1015 family protein [Cyclobacteriaceae bacterium]
MVFIKSFRAFRPKEKFVSQVAARPYDVINTAEARREAEGNPKSFLHVTKPEISFPDSQDPYESSVYLKGASAFRKLVDDKIFVQDKKNSFYLYTLVINGREQNGLVGCISVDDYIDRKIKVHELTRPDKEADRKRHIEYTNLHAEPVFLAYRSTGPGLKLLAAEIKKKKPEYDFTTDDGIRHTLWKTDKEDHLTKITALVESLDSLYIADGHHRTAAAASVGTEMKKKFPDGSEHQNIMAVIFPHDELRILDYNRVARDLNGLERDEFFQLLGQSFQIRSNGPMQYKPSRLHEFGMYLGGNWFVLELKMDRFHPITRADELDVQILTSEILTPILGIKDIRTDKRIDFVGGIRGLGELENLVNSGKMEVAFALHPVTMNQLMDISDSGGIMPPKSTWFEPKLRSGLFVHALY